MKLLLKRLRRTSAKGSYVYLHEKGAVRLDIGKPAEVLDEIAYEILKQDGDIIEKILDEESVDEAVPGKKKLSVYKNKMLDEHEEK